MSTNTNSAGNPSSVPSTAKGVPLLDIGRQYAPLRDEMAAALLRVCDRRSVRARAGAVTELEGSVAGYCGTIHAVGCASGSDGLAVGPDGVGRWAGRPK